MSKLITYDSTSGNREDIYDVLQLVSPEETPLFTTLPDAVAAATHHQWVEYTLATGSGNAAIEGATATGSSTSSTARKGNYTQIIEKDGCVSGTQQEVSKVGGADDLAFEMRKKMLEWKIGAEIDLILETSAAGASATARTMTGLIDAMQTNRVTGSATTIALTEEKFNDLLQKIFESGAVADTVYVNGFNKRRISAFTTNNSRTMEVVDGRLKNRVSVYESEFGVMQIVLERYVTNTIGLVMKNELFRKAWLRKPKTYPLAKRGDLDEFQIVGELTLEYLNERAGGVLSAFASSTS